MLLNTQQAHEVMLRELKEEHTSFKVFRLTNLNFKFYRFTFLFPYIILLFHLFANDDLEHLKPHIHEVNKLPPLNMKWRHVVIVDHL